MGHRKHVQYRGQLADIFSRVWGLLILHLLGGYAELQYN